MIGRPRKIDAHQETEIADVIKIIEDVYGLSFSSFGYTRKGSKERRLFVPRALMCYIACHHAGLGWPVGYAHYAVCVNRSEPPERTTLYGAIREMYRVLSAPPSYELWPALEALRRYCEIRGSDSLLFMEAPILGRD